MRYVLLIGLAALVGSSASAATRIREQFVLSGALNTSSVRVDSTSGGCGYVPRLRLYSSSRFRYRVLGVSSGGMKLGNGRRVARVSISVPNFHGPGIYDARRPVVEYDRTPVQVGIARNATTGAGSWSFQAEKGTIHVLSAQDVGRAGHVGHVTGTVHAVLGDHGKVVRLRGRWSCTIAPEANGSAPSRR
jgi:hypothetical protein